MYAYLLQPSDILGWLRMSAQPDCCNRNAARLRFIAQIGVSSRKYCLECSRHSGVRLKKAVTYFLRYSSRVMLRKKKSKNRVIVVITPVLCHEPQPCGVCSATAVAVLAYLHTEFFVVIYYAYRAIGASPTASGMLDKMLNNRFTAVASDRFERPLQPTVRPSAQRSHVPRDS